MHNDRLEALSSASYDLARNSESRKQNT